MISVREGMYLISISIIYPADDLGKANIGRGGGGQAIQIADRMPPGGRRDKELSLGANSHQMNFMSYKLVLMLDEDSIHN